MKVLYNRWPNPKLYFEDFADGVFKGSFNAARELERFSAPFSRVLPDLSLAGDDQRPARTSRANLVNWLEMAQQAFNEVAINLAVRKETATMEDGVGPLRASMQSHVETERESGLEVGKEWAEEDGQYGELLRIAKAVEEARREIDVQTLQNLIDPEHKMDAGDWVSFWEDRGFSGDSEASDVWVGAFADRAARLFRKVRN
jgi:hypothetical protein